MSAADTTTALQDAPRHDTGTLGKAMQVLEVIATAQKPMRFTDVLKKVDQPRGTLHRQISNLIEEGLVDISADNAYTPGIRLLKFASRAWSQNTLRSLAQPHIEALHKATGETVHLGQMGDLEVIYLDKIESNQTVRMHSQVGKASPLYCTGIGKAMLARLPLGEAKARTARIEFHRYTPTTITSATALMRELNEIKTTSISHDREEHESGIYCVAASIASPDGETIGGLSVTAPRYRISDETIGEWEHLVRSAAYAIENDMAQRLGPRS
ncbi:IclR family transcriptional regulator [Pseudahrensia aquimaris]|uniref:IclR family transcriptional regulator n=1 Tax=Pseudahrensia aquimaris TaxID=744461 RepID=A0ABW3F986_9HYPH